MRTSPRTVSQVTAAKSYTSHSRSYNYRTTYVGECSQCKGEMWARPACCGRERHSYEGLLRRSIRIDLRSTLAKRGHWVDCSKFQNGEVQLYWKYESWLGTDCDMRDASCTSSRVTRDVVVTGDRNPRGAANEWV